MKRYLRHSHKEEHKISGWMEQQPQTDARSMHSVPPTQTWTLQMLGMQQPHIPNPSVRQTGRHALLLQGLEAAVAKLGAGVDELEVDGLLALDVHNNRLAHGDHPLLGAHNATLEHNPVVLDDTVVGEATNGVDALLGQISLGGGSLVNLAIANLGHIHTQPQRQATG